MNEDVLHLGYLTIRLTKEEERRKEGEREIQQRVYELHVTGEISLDIKEDNSHHATYNAKGRINQPRSFKKQETPLWLKKIEREIVKKTHPDKLTGLSEKEVKEKTEMFIKTKECIQSKNFIDILPIALSLGVDFSSLSEKFEEEIINRIREIQHKILEIKKSISWKWFDLPEEDKIKAIDLILKNSGIKRSEKDIRRAVRKKFKRKTGTRPKSLKEIRGLK
jgi:hypothetical protein